MVVVEVEVVEVIGVVVGGVVVVEEVVVVEVVGVVAMVRGGFGFGGRTQLPPSSPLPSVKSSLNVNHNISFENQQMRQTSSSPPFPLSC